MQIRIKIIPHEEQKYPTPADWRYEERGILFIKISDMANEKYEMLLAIHEMIEAMLCRFRAISEQSVTNFDIKFESEREQGLHKLEDEPGHDPRAPYRKEHIFAEQIERLLAKELEVDWEEYNDKVINL